MKPEFLESAGFIIVYLHNFQSIDFTYVTSARISVRICSFAKEMSLSTRRQSNLVGSLPTSSRLAIQRIVGNYLENKLVKQGGSARSVPARAEAVQVEAYASQWRCQGSKKAVGVFAIQFEGSDQFQRQGKFGYQEMFRDYLSQASSLRSNLKQNAISSQNAAASQEPGRDWQSYQSNRG